MDQRLFLKFLTGIVVFALSSSVGAAQSSQAGGPDDEGDDMPSVLASPEHPLAVGWVVATNRGAGTIEIRHRPIQTLNMEYMTMIFRVSDPGLLTGLTAGDKIRFKVERDGRSYVITRIENSI